MAVTMFDCAAVRRVLCLLGVAAVSLSADGGRVEVSSQIITPSSAVMRGRTPITSVCEYPHAYTGTAEPGLFGAELYGGAGGASAANFQYGLTASYGSATPYYSFYPGPCYGGFSISVSGLACNTEYHYRAVVTGYGGTTYGADATFTTLPCPPPDVETGAASDIAPTTATLNGTANPNDGATDGYFQYGLTASYGSSTPSQSLGSGRDSIPIGGGGVSGLKCNTLYHYRAVASNAVGTTNGSDATFTTAACPSSIPAPIVVTGVPGGVSYASATLNGTANPNGSATDAFFEYGLTASYGSATPNQNLGAGSASLPIGGGSITGLTCNTQYHFRARASNAVGTTYGLDVTFTTAVCPPPTVVTGVADGITSRFATLHGSANPNGAATAAHFEYGLTAGYGSATSTSNLAAGNVSVAIGAASIHRLNCGALYHFRAVASNNGGTTNGADATFTTSPCLSPFQVASDFDGDHKTDVALFRASTGTWWILDSSSGFNSSMSLAFGVATDVPAPGDYDGDGRIDPAVFRPSTGTWFVLLSSTSYTAAMVAVWGTDGDVPVPGDYDGDHLTDLAVYQPSIGYWYIQLSTTGRTTNLPVPWGLSTDVPVPSDYDGDGRTDIAVYRPSTGVWHVLKSGSGFASVAYTLGLPSDVPVPGDYDADGKIDVAVYRPSSGDWVILLSSSGYAASALYTLGVPGDIAAPGDYDGDSQTDVAVFRPSTGQWIILTSSSDYAAETTLQFGMSGDTPIANAVVQHARPIVNTPGTDTTRTSDFDGDRRSDVTFFRPSDSTWNTLKSTANFSASSQRTLDLSFNGVLAPGDFDGDGITDPAVYRRAIGSWNVVLSSTGVSTYFNPVFAWSGGDIPVPGDYDGDGKTDTAQYRFDESYYPAIGYWSVAYSSTNRTTTSEFRWGHEYDVPVPADYDGDGKTDVATYRSTDATWSVLLSSTNYTGSLIVGWGQAGDIAVPGDYDGDGKADFAVYRPTNGTWYVLTSTSGRQTSFSMTWGNGTDTPVPGDFDGDTKTDIAVWRPSSGVWWILQSKTNYSTFITCTWGTSGDIPILGRP